MTQTSRSHDEEDRFLYELSPHHSGNDCIKSRTHKYDYLGDGVYCCYLCGDLFDDDPER
jgi:hypothetical protein